MPTSATWSHRVIGGATYRIWGSLRSAAARVPGLRRRPVPRRRWRTLGLLAHLRGSRRRRGRCLRGLALAPTDVRELAGEPQRRDRRSSFVEIYSDWNLDPPGEVHIDRVGSEGALSPPVTEDVMAATAPPHGGRPQVARASVAPGRPALPGRAGPERVGRAAGLGAFGGRAGSVDGAWHLRTGRRRGPDREDRAGHRELPGHSAPRPVARSARVRQPPDQPDRRPDALERRRLLPVHRFVRATRAWRTGSTPSGAARGVMLLRYDGTTEGALDPRVHPTATKVKLADLAAHLPAGTVAVSPEERQREIAARRKHVQIRFGN